MTTLGTQEILETLAHRYPMLLVDRIVECDDNERIVGLKNVSINEPYFQGHFPNHPVMPGVLQLEAMAQTGGILLIRRASVLGKIPYLISIDKAKFRRAIVPGDQMRIEIDFLKIRTRMAQFRGRVYVDGQLASEAELMCMISDEQTPE